MIIMLVVSVLLSISSKFFPDIARLTVTEEARSLEEMSSLAKFAFEAFEKFQAMNN